MDNIKLINGGWYTAKFDEPSKTLKIIAKNSKFFYFVSLFSACDKPGKRDIHIKLYDFTVRKKGDCTVVQFKEKSSLWDLKIYTLEFYPEYIKYYYNVFGKGNIDRAHFFRGWINEKITIEKEMGSIPGFDTVFSPSPNFFEKNYYFSGEPATITVGCDTKCWGSALVCAPFCYALNEREDKLWIWAGLGVRPGNYTFEEFNYNENPTKRIFGTCGFNCNYNGKLKINERWETPHFIFGVSRNPYNAIDKYVRYLERSYDVNIKRKREIHKWWKAPIFCGWGEQYSLAIRDYGCRNNNPTGKYCTQKNHDLWLGILKEKKINPGIVIIDATWQRKDLRVDKRKWPDLRGWIDKRHKDGMKVLLWMCAWNKEGVPDDECIRRGNKAVAVDPTNPKYEERLRRWLYQIISSDKGCLNADGLKIDGLLSYPLGPDVKNYGDLWGLELHKKYMSIIYNEIKKHKDDAIISTFYANPYMSDTSDMVRAADMFTIKGTPERSLIHRAKILKISMPGCLIDTDWQFFYDKRDNWSDIMKTQVKLGVPCLYHVKNVVHFRPFTIPYFDNFKEKDYKLISKIWKDYWNYKNALNTERSIED